MQFSIQITKLAGKEHIFTRLGWFTLKAELTAGTKINLPSQVTFYITEIL